MDIAMCKEMARKVYVEVLRPSFLEAMNREEMLQVIFAYDMTHHVWCSDYAMKLEIMKNLEKYGFKIKHRIVAHEIAKLFAEEMAMDEVKIYHNPGKDTGDLMVNREEFYMFLLMNE